MKTNILYIIPHLIDDLEDILPDIWILNKLTDCQQLGIIELGRVYYILERSDNIRPCPKIQGNDCPKTQGICNLSGLPKSVLGL